MNCPHCNAWDWTTDHAGFMCRHYRPDGRFCKEAASNTDLAARLAAWEPVVRAVEAWAAAWNGHEIGPCAEDAELLDAINAVPKEHRINGSQ